jgi:multidrug efflux pump subunit AcrA (membrane-fusion protein)
MANVGAIQVSKLVLVSFLLGFTVSCRQGGPTAEAQQPQGIPVQLAKVQTGTVQDASEFVGNLEARRSVTLRSEVDARIVQILVESGDRVSRGTLAIQLNPERSQANLGSADARIAAARAARENALAEVRAQEAQLISDQAELQLQTTELARTTALTQEGAFSQQDLDRAIQSRDTAAAELRATQQRIRAARATVLQQEALLREAQASAASVGQDVVDTRVVAPFTGVIGDIPVKVGDYVQSGDTLTTITQNDFLDLRIAIPLEQGPELRMGLPVQITNEQGQVLTQGQVSFISPQVNSQAQTILVKATFDNSAGRLRDGQFVRARVIWDESPGVLVPTAAISRLGNQTFIYVAEPPAPPAAGQSPSEQAPQGTSEQAPQGQPPALIARQRQVTLGNIQGNNYQVLEGLKPGEQIVVSGVLNLSDGVPIIPQAENQGQVSQQ